MPQPYSLTCMPDVEVPMDAPRRLTHIYATKNNDAIHHQASILRHKLGLPF